MGVALICVQICFLQSRMHTGFLKKSTNFIQSYLNKRIQKVNANNKFSAWEDINSSVPQGSILGPDLFNIFINDIFNFLTTCDMCNYADDNTL